MSKVLPTRLCPKCREAFTPIPRKDGTLPDACKDCIRSFNWDQHRETFLKGLKAATAAKKLAARRRIEAQLVSQFGAISDREAALYAFAVGLGYTRGYDAGYHQGQKKQRA